MSWSNQETDSITLPSDAGPNTYPRIVIDGVNDDIQFFPGSNIEGTIECDFSNSGILIWCSNEIALRAHNTNDSNTDGAWFSMAPVFTHEESGDISIACGIYGQLSIDANIVQINPVTSSDRFNIRINTYLSNDSLFQIEQGTYILWPSGQHSGDMNWNSFSGNVDSNGNLTLNHGLFQAPQAVFVQMGNHNQTVAKIINITATQVLVGFRNSTTGSPIAQGIQEDGYILYLTNNS